MRSGKKTLSITNYNIPQEPEMTEMSIDEIFNGIPGSDYQV